MSESITEFVSMNSGFLLTLAGVITACCGGFFGFILKSRCTKIECCCVKFERDVVNLSKTDPKAVEVQMSGAGSSGV
jgi:hypothetical protein